MNRAPTPIDPKLLERIQGAIDDIRAGKMVILVDDEDRENEGDFCMAAELVTPEAVNFMAMHGRGLICLTMSEAQVDRLQLPLMAAPGRGGPPLGTAFTVSIEARTGVSTGISAADRAHTMRVAADPKCRPEDLVTPGHVFPLRARDGGVCRWPAAGVGRRARARQGPARRRQGRPRLRGRRPEVARRSP